MAAHEAIRYRMRALTVARAAGWRLIRRFALTLIILGGTSLLPAAIAQDYDRMSGDQLERELARVISEITEELVKVQDYLVRYDQILNLEVATGNLDRNEAARRLQARGSELYHNSFTDADFRQLIEQHRAATRAYFGLVENTLRRAQRWPDPSAAEEYRALALSLLEELQGEYASRVSQGRNPQVLLADAAELLHWTSGQRRLPAAENPFVGSYQRATAVIPNAELRRQLTEMDQKYRREGARPRPKPIPLAESVRQLLSSVQAQPPTETTPQFQPGYRVEPQPGVATATQGTSPQSYVTAIDFPNGDRYEGEMLNNQLHGQGVYFWAAGTGYHYAGDRYEGAWQNNAMNGQGTYFYSNGTRYEGQWHNNQKSGQGAIYFTDGNSYVGNWANDRRNGQGTMEDPFGNSYTGSWQDDAINGQGTMRYADGSHYTGEWRNNLKHGYGTFVAQNGDRYDGAWLNDAMHGQGTLTYQNGDRYVGEFLQGRPSGGWVYWTNGQQAWTYRDERGNWVTNGSPRSD